MFCGSMGLVTISFPLSAPCRITSTRSMKSCLVLKLPINFVWSGALRKKKKKEIKKIVKIKYKTDFKNKSKKIQPFLTCLLHEKK